MATCSSFLANKLHGGQPPTVFCNHPGIPNRLRLTLPSAPAFPRAFLLPCAPCLSDANQIYNLSNLLQSIESPPPMGKCGLHGMLCCRKSAKGAPGRRPPALFWIFRRKKAPARAPRCSPLGPACCDLPSPAAPALPSTPQHGTQTQTGVRHWDMARTLYKSSYEQQH